jgi:hypothetical protein
LNKTIARAIGRGYAPIQEVAVRSWQNRLGLTRNWSKKDLPRGRLSALDAVENELRKYEQTRQQATTRALPTRAIGGRRCTGTGADLKAGQLSEAIGPPPAMNWTRWWQNLPDQWPTSNARTHSLARHRCQNARRTSR